MSLIPHLMPSLGFGLSTGSLICFGWQQVRSAQHLRAAAGAARPLAWLLLLTLGAATLWAAGHGLVRVQQHLLAWRQSARFISWLPVAICAAAIAAGLLINHFDPRFQSGFAALNTFRVVSTVLALAAGVMAAYLFSPEDEPALEVLLAAPRPLAWLVLERLAAMALVLGGVGLAGTCATLALTPIEDVALFIVQWAVPMVFFAGVGVFTTIASRQIVFGIALTLVVWFGMVFAGDAMRPGVTLDMPILREIQPYLWPFYPFLAPGAALPGDYALNRIVVTLVGLALVAYAVRKLRDEERVLLGATSA